MLLIGLRLDDCHYERLVDMGSIVWKLAAPPRETFFQGGNPLELRE